MDSNVAGKEIVMKLNPTDTAINAIVSVTDMLTRFVTENMTIVSRVNLKWSLWETGIDRE